jgi:N-acetylneuraminic acid mutarotase
MIARLLAPLVALVFLSACSQPAPTLEPLAEGLSWAQRAAAPTALYEAQGLAVGNTLYVFGGFFNARIQATPKSYAFHAPSKRWRALRPLPEAVTHAGQAAYGDDIYLAGGFVGDHPGPPSNRVWIYNTKRNRWRPGPPLPKARGGGALVALGGKLHFFGGAVREGHRYRYDSSDHWTLDVEAGGTTWRRAAPLPRARNHLAGVALGGKLYAIGGQRLGDEVDRNLRLVHEYDPAKDRWRRVADLPYPVGHIGASSFAHEGRLIVVGGSTQGRRRVASVIAYDPARDRWRRLTPLPEGRSSPVAGAIGGRLYVTTGMRGGPQATTWMGRFR